MCYSIHIQLFSNAITHYCNKWSDYSYNNGITCDIDSSVMCRMEGEEQQKRKFNFLCSCVSVLQSADFSLYAGRTNMVERATVQLGVEIWKLIYEGHRQLYYTAKTTMTRAQQPEPDFKTGVTKAGARSLARSFVASMSACACFWSGIAAAIAYKSLWPGFTPWQVCVQTYY